MQGGRLERGLSSVELVTGVAFGAYCQARHGFGRTITWYGAAHLHSNTLIGSAPAGAVGAFYRRTRPASIESSNWHFTMFWGISDVNLADCTRRTCVCPTPQHRQSLQDVHTDLW